MTATPLRRFNYTSYLHLSTPSADPAKNWIQIAKVGNFTSTKYGKFQIAATHLSEMVRNFNAITPGRVPLDYDHLSNNPQRPDDGIAAGWAEALEVRNGGTELWCLAAFTPHAAERIRNGEYRYTSPSFTTQSIDTHTGAEVGAMLHAIAITNRPFLQQMAGLALCDDDVVGDLALSDTVRPTLENPMTPLHLSAVGQKVTFKIDTDAAPELTPDERAGVYEVKAVSDDGAFVRLTLEGKDFGWFKVDQLAPTAAPDKTKQPPASMDPLVPETPEAAAALAAVTGTRKKVTLPVPPKEEETRRVTLTADEANHRLLALGNDRAKANGITLSAAIKELRSDEVASLVAMRDGHAAVAAAPAAPISLHTTPTTTFYDLVVSLKAERKIGDLEAVNLAQSLRPDLAQKYAEGEF